MNDFAFIACVVGGLLLYFLPALIGGSKRNATAIFLLNLLLGWSLVGWVVALVWATKKEDEPTRVVVQQAPAEQPKTPPILPADPQARVNRLRELRDTGAITQDEFLDLVSRG